MELIILFFYLLIFSDEYQTQPFGLIINAYISPENDAEIELAIRIKGIGSGTISTMKDVGISTLKTYNNRNIGNISLCPLISGKVYI